MTAILNTKGEEMTAHHLAVDRRPQQKEFAIADQIEDLELAAQDARDALDYMENALRSLKGENSALVEEEQTPPTLTEALRLLQDEAHQKTGDLLAWAHDFELRLQQAVGPLYTEIIVNRLLRGNRTERGTAMVPADRLFSLLFDSVYGFYPGMKSAQQALFDAISQAIYLARVLEKLDARQTSEEAP